MDWKKENPKKRYIDEITDDEARHIAFLSRAKPDELRITSIEREVNGNNIPHIRIHYTYLEDLLMEDVDSVTGIFENLNVYIGEYHSAYCQKEIFEYFTKIGLE